MKLCTPSGEAALIVCNSFIVLVPGEFYRPRRSNVALPLLCGPPRARSPHMGYRETRPPGFYEKVAKPQNQKSTARRLLTSEDTPGSIHRRAALH
jgi:hypothetical protein